MSYNYNSGYGQALLNMVQNRVPTFGKIFVVFDADDAGEEKVTRAQEIFKVDPDGVKRVYAETLSDGTTPLEQALAAATSNNNDVILLDADGTHTLSGGYAMTKSRVHLIGMDGGGRLLQQGVKIQTPSTDTAAYVWKDTGTRNTYENIKFIQASTNAAALTVLQLGGEGTRMKNVSAGFGVVDNLDQANAYEVIIGTDSATFEDCYFGVDTLLTSAARSVMIVDQVTSGQEFKSNLFRKCTFVISSSETNAQHIKMAAAGDILFSNHFDECVFIASLDSAGGIALAKSVSTANGTTKGTLLFSYPRVHGVTNFGTNGTNNDNLYVVAPLNVNTDIVGVQPIAT